MKKRIAEISTAFRVDGLAGVRKALSDTAKGAKDVAASTTRIGDDKLIRFAGAAGAAANAVADIADSAKKAENALNGLDGNGLAARLRSEAQAAGRALESIRPEDTAARKRDAGARIAAQNVDVSGIDPAVAKRAVAAYKKALDKGVELDVYVDPEKSVRLVQDQLRALERKAGKLNIQAFDPAAVKRAADAIKDAAAQGKALSEYVDASTGTVFDAEQLGEVSKYAAKLDKDFTAAAKSAENLAKAEKTAADRQAELAAATKKTDEIVAGLAASDRDASSRRAARTVDVSGVDPAVAKRAVAAYRKAAAGGVELDVYIDEEKSVRLVRDQLRALERRAGKLNIEAFDTAAVKRAADAVRGAAKEGKVLSEYVDKATGTVFDAEQLGEVVKFANKLDKEFSDAAVSANKVAKAEKNTAREAATVARRAAEVAAGFGLARSVAGKATSAVKGMGTAGAGVVRQIDKVARSALIMGATIGRSTASATRKLKGLAVAAGGVALGGGVGVGAAAAFGVKSARDSVEASKQTRSIAALTGSDVSVSDFFAQYGARAGLEGTDLAQVMSGFTSAIKDARDPTTEQARLFKALGVNIQTASGQLRPFSHIFTEFLAKADALPAQFRGGLFTTIFGEDDALKVSQLSGLIRKELPTLNGQYQQAMQEGRLTTNAQIASITRFERQSIRLKNTWAGFKRELFVGVEPIFTDVLRIAERILATNRKDVIKRFFVQPLEKTLGFARQVFKVFVGFDPFETIGDKAIAIPRWLINLKVTLGLIGGLLKAAGVAIAEFARQIASNTGLDFSKVFNSDSIRDFVAVLVTRIFRIFRDIKRIASGQLTGLESEFATVLVNVGVKVALFVLQVEAQFQAAFDRVKGSVLSAIDTVKTAIGGIVGYVKTAWAEMQSAGDGMGFDGMTTLLGKVLYILAETVDYIERFAKAFDQVFIRNGAAPAGFEWMLTVRDVLQEWGTAVANIAKALKPVISAFDAVLSKIGGINTATLILAGVLTSKLVGAAKSLAAVFASIGAFFGLGGAAAGEAAVAGVAGEAIGGAAAAGAAGGLATVLTRIGTAISALATRFLPVLAVFATAYAAYKLLEANVNQVLDLVGMGQKSVDDAVARARKSLSDNLDAGGLKPGAMRLDEDLSRPAGSYSKPVYTPYVVDRMIRYDQGDTSDPATIKAEFEAKYAAKPTNTVNLYLDQETPVQVSATDSQLAAMRRSRSLSLGRS